MAKMRVLLVDDEQDFLTLMSRRIESWGYDVVPVSGGREALEAIKSGKADIVILDYMMPDMDGIKTLKGIRKIKEKMPVIMFTAHLEEKAMKGTENMQVSAYIPKLSVYSDSQSALKTTLDIHNKLLEKMDG
ncbi:MAG: response regulator [Candidatus Omnitrophota bacterium]|jgi:DNA-binding response OmpR family regulator